ncbi:MAG TPA: hypothetical protein PKD37_05985 [Oligoflexia bacterium]|nr:hypothetical protein [Oligoflexia bacterium]HMP27510.1 hypothetical protein [Oligoflexia bacterium]
MNEIVSSVKWPENVTELHFHLGGSVPIYRLWEMAIDRGIRGIGRGYDEFLKNMRIQPERSKDLDTYLETYDRVELIQSGPAAVRESVIIAIHRAYRTGGMPELGPGGEGGSLKPLFKLGKLELRLNPMKRTGAVFLKGAQAGLYDVDRIISAACSAAEEVEIAFKNQIKVGLIFCFARDMDHRANLVLAEKTSLWKEKYKNIVGIDVAGPESKNNFSDPGKLREIKEAYDLVGSGIGRTAHIGETPHVDCSTFVKTIEALNPQRVAHPLSAVRAFWEKKDDRGLKILKERKITVELCVHSNLLSHAINDIQEYKQLLETFDDYQIPYTFSTDAPSLQLSSLGSEMVTLLNNKVATAEQILRAFSNANKASFIK